MKLLSIATIALSLCTLTSCSPINWGNMVQDEHHRNSRFDKYLEQCLEKDRFICERRYEQLGIE